MTGASTWLQVRVLHGQTQSFRRRRPLRPHARADRRHRADRRRQAGLHDAFDRRRFSSAPSGRRNSTSANFRCRASRSRPRRAIAPMSGVPAFVSRAFRHTSIYVRTDRIKKPADLKGKKVGVPEYQLTANVWARAILQDDHGVKPSDIHWVRGGIEDAGPAGEDQHQAAAGREARGRAEGQIDFQHCCEAARSMASSRRAPPSACRSTRPMSAGCFPIRSRPPRTISSAPAFSRSCTWSACGATLAEKHPWLPGAVFKAFEQAKEDGAGTIERYVGDQSDAAVRRGAA